MNKLSELSKPVAEVRKYYPLGIDSPAGVFFQPMEGLSAVNFGDFLYSQEYVSALLAELEASSLQCRGIEQERELFRLERTAHQLHAQELEQRITELEAIRTAAEKLVRCKGRYHSEQNYRALSALFGITTPDLPPVDGDAEAVIAELRAKLATPVRLPEGLAQKIKVTGYYEALNEMMDCVRAAGFKCVGDEQ